MLNHGLAKGAKIVAMPRFDFEEMLRHRREPRHHPASRRAAGRAGARERAAGDDRDFSKLELVTSGAAPLDQDLAERAEERIGTPVRQGYGMTELSPVTNWTPQEEAERSRPAASARCCRTPKPGWSTPSPARTSPRASAGELWIRGPQMMRGYLEKPEATAETITEDGWLRTGDIARIDADGNAYIVDRLKELIKYKGYQVPPAELEAVLSLTRRSRMPA